MKFLTENFVAELDKQFLCGMIKKRLDNNMRKQRDQPVTTEKREVLVFVYGSLKTYGGLNGYLTESELVGDARIESKDFVMRDLGAYPALQKVAVGSGSLIKGELYIIDQGVLSNLDKAEGYPTLYSRDLIKVMAGNNEFKAWVYHIDGNESLFEMGAMAQSPVIASGEWDSNRGCPVTGTADLSELGKPPDEDGQIMEEFESMGTTSDYDDAINFTVDGPVYITSDQGDYWGPFDSIKDAMKGLHQIDPSGVNVLTIGFRLIRNDLSDHELADINTMTENIPV